MLVSKPSPIFMQSVPDVFDKAHFICAKSTKLTTWCNWLTLKNINQWLKTRNEAISKRRYTKGVVFGTSGHKFSHPYPACRRWNGDILGVLTIWKNWKRNVLFLVLGKSLGRIKSSLSWNLIYFLFQFLHGLFCFSAWSLTFVISCEWKLWYTLVFTD